MMNHSAPILNGVRPTPSMVCGQASVWNSPSIDQRDYRQVAPSISRRGVVLLSGRQGRIEMSSRVVAGARATPARN
jgi:hypothetical protein